MIKKIIEFLKSLDCQVVSNEQFPEDIQPDTMDWVNNHRPW